VLILEHGPISGSLSRGRPPRNSVHVQCEWHPFPPPVVPASVDFKAAHLSQQVAVEQHPCPFVHASQRGCCDDQSWSGLHCAKLHHRICQLHVNCPTASLECGAEAQVVNEDDVCFAEGAHHMWVR
jgi:hypothetical protein